MNTNNKEYDDYSALDAPDHLLQVLAQFFQRKQNTYKFALAKKHFDHIVQQDAFVEANRIFKVITGTDLITKKHVLHYRTAQGMRYLIKKDYAQSAQRDQRNACRAHVLYYISKIVTWDDSHSLVFTIRIYCIIFGSFWRVKY